MIRASRPVAPASRPPRNSSARSEASHSTPLAGRAALPPAESEPASRWTFLTNHAHVLIVLWEEPSLVLRQVAARIGITERAVQRIVADLEAEGFIAREKVGRQNHYRIQADRPLRHPIEAHRQVRDLLELVADPGNTPSDANAKPRP